MIHGDNELTLRVLVAYYWQTSESVGYESNRFQDTNVVVSDTGASNDVSGNALQFINEQDITNSKLYEIIGAGPTYTFMIKPQTISDVLGASTNITFVPLI